MLRSQQVLLLIAAILATPAAVAECASISDPPEGSEIFNRTHALFHFNGDKPSIGLDEVALWIDTEGSQCFLLETVGPNYHQCQVKGELEKSSDAFVFRTEACSLSFYRIEDKLELAASEGWERLGEGGTCSQNFCGMFGAVKSGLFSRSDTWEPRAH